MQQKKKVCKSCDTEQFIFSKGRCKRCASIEDSKPIKKQTEKNKEKKREQSVIRDSYFEYHLEKCTYSEESGKNIVATRANICHLFYKRTYKSVQGDLDNYVYLTLEEHSRFDQLLDTNDFKQLEKEFKCWNIVVQRMEKLLPKISEKGSLKIKFEDYISEKL